MGEILLQSIFYDLKCKDYKIHFAKRSSDGYEPLDSYISNFDEWKEWNQYAKRDDYNRPYIFSLIRFYPEKDTWLFGGIWKVVSTDMSKKPYPYVVEFDEKYSQYVGRLKIKYSYNNRSVRVKMEEHFSNMVIKELLEEPFTTVTFPGYRNVDIPFRTLETIMKKDAVVWKTALAVKGIYLITDTKTGKKYVGKADGDLGFWQRWGDYISDGHGGDVDLKKLVDNKGFEYIRQYYKFSILEVLTGWDENDIDERESYWKRVLMSRMEEVGHNKN